MRKMLMPAAGIVLMLATTTQPAAASDRTPPEAKPAPASATVLTPSASRTVDGCTTVQARLPELARAAAKTGKTSISCLEPTKSSTGKARQPGPSARLEPFPDWCNDAPGSWIFSYEIGREWICSYADLTLNVINLNTGAVIGQIYFDQYAFEFTSSSSPTFGYQVLLDMYGGWGEIGGTFAQGSASCIGVCTVNSSDFPPQAV
ncbi:hypothetical protein DMB66_19665 [Actinoplanes sp. ATCC 53533]|uniref:hypothetical protein n=1 Tax=Actinoplanes sp. ATCC 53533 TaxID=1288362 RepID=UPI000F76AA54|nr:hypothetical protein [Actinoplanes sp. ATCC 53533]RSM64543.1 hypothetical protein DMB66_19665 [Actinoplanes sp. ATCC 53533]